MMLDKIGGIDESKDLPASEDYNAWLRIAKLTDQFLYLSHKLGYYLIHNQGMSCKDMSLSGRHAVTEFLEILSYQEKLKLESNLRYQSGRFNYLSYNLKKSKKDLLFVLKNGNISLRIRAFVMIVMMMVK